MRLVVVAENKFAAVRHQSWPHSVGLIGTTFRPLKHSTQYTGILRVGLNGTVVSFPHPAHMTWLSITGRFPTCVLHCLQRFGSCVNPLSLKNCCSPAENPNSAPHSAHVRSRSTKVIEVPRAASKGENSCLLVS